MHSEDVDLYGRPRPVGLSGLVQSVVTMIHDARWRSTAGDSSALACLQRRGIPLERGPNREEAE